MSLVTKFVLSFPTGRLGWDLGLNSVSFLLLKRISVRDLLLWCAFQEISVCINSGEKKVRDWTDFLTKHKR